MNANDLVKIFREKGRTLGSVESLTGGLFASTMTSIPGASHFYKGGMVTYMTEEKVRLLGVRYEEIDKHGVISKEVASSMALRGAHILKCDYCVSFTGNAGPGVLEDKPVGTVYIAVYCYNRISVYHFEFKGNREQIRKQCVESAINILGDLIVANN